VTRAMKWAMKEDAKAERRSKSIAAARVEAVAKVNLIMKRMIDGVEAKLERASLGPSTGGAK
jgi:hypothetical protein